MLFFEDILRESPRLRRAHDLDDAKLRGFWTARVSFRTRFEGLFENQGSAIHLCICCGEVCGVTVARIKGLGYTCIHPREGLQIGEEGWQWGWRQIRGMKTEPNAQSLEEIFGNVRDCEVCNEGQFCLYLYWRSDHSRMKVVNEEGNGWLERRELDTIIECMVMVNEDYSMGRRICDAEGVQGRWY